MKAYKIWYDTKHFIHKDSTPDNVTWTENIADALDVPQRGKALTFFYFTLGFNIGARYDALHLL
jgi:hypothetical protein